VLKRRLDGANVLIMGQEADQRGAHRRPGRGRQALFLSDKPMRQTLPPDLRARLEARLAADEGKARRHGRGETRLRRLPHRQCAGRR
jgi:hypothetical protein